MKEIFIDKEISGWWDGISTSVIRKQFEEAKENEEIRLVVNCPGGDCFEGISMYNYIRDFARNHTNRIISYVQGMAASAASWIVCAANSVNPENKIIVEDNSIFMIHNCWGIACGDHREMQKSADFTKRIDNLIIKMLSNRSKKNEKKIEKLMADETWYFGNEIFENGFCDEVIKTETDPLADFDNKMNEAKVAFNSCQKKIKDEAEKNPSAYNEAFNKSYSAFNSICEKTDFSVSNINSEKSEKKEFVMNKQELLAQNKALYDEIAKEGSENAVKEERKRVSDLLAKFGEVGSVNDALTFIENGNSLSDGEVVNALLASQKNKIESEMKNKAVADRQADEPPAFVPKTENKNSDAEEERVNNAFRAAMGL